MKRILTLTLVLALLLCGCGAASQAQAEPPQTTAAPAAPTAQETEPPAEAATEAPTEPPTEPEPEVFCNPLNGEILEEPFTGRIFANTVSNMEENLPHVGVVQADMLIETFVNRNNIIRCLALFTDIESVEAIGSTRSTRPIFNQLAQHYDLVLTHAGGSSQALGDAADRGIDHFNIDAWVVASTGASYRDEEYGRPYENTLFGVGSGIKAYAESQGVEMTLERDYGFRFTDDGTPADGEEAEAIDITFRYDEAKKQTTMVYDQDAGKYVYNQYDQVMTDQITGETEMFTNVLILLGDVSHQGLYHVLDFNAGGTGYFACGGKLAPITWTCAGDSEPILFYRADGTELELGRGNSYIAICSNDSNVVWQSTATASETIASETVDETTAP